MIVRVPTISRHDRRNRPFLIALIGGRYSRIRLKERAERAVAEAGFATTFERLSVTDLEIDFGAFFAAALGNLVFCSLGCAIFSGNGMRMTAMEPLLEERRGTMFGFSKKAETTKSSNRPKCSLCGKEIVMISGMMMPSAMMQHAQSGFACGACGAFECYECCDNRRPCRCGQSQWQTRMYIPSDVIKQIMPNAEIVETPYAKLGDNPFQIMRTRR